MFTHTVTVRFSDTDQLGHVNHARYLTYCEDARLALLAELSGGLAGRGLILARVECDYVAPAFLDRGAVTVAVAVTAVGRSSIGMGYELTQAGAVVARARSTVVAYDYDHSRSRPLDEAERAALLAEVATP